MRFLCIFAMPRTGSSHLNKLLKSCPSINAKSELFHGHTKNRFSDPEMEQIEARAGGAFPDNAAFIKWRRRNPANTLEALYEGGGSRVVAFKVFPGHLRKEIIDDQLLGRDDIGFAILSRRPIECFISGLKAKSVSRFGVIDTTPIKPVLSVGDFLDWAERMKRWYDWTRKTLEERNIAHADISFERHLDGLSGEEALSRILPLLEPLGLSRLEMPPRVIEGRRQDKEVRYQDRAANWDGFLAEAKADPECASYLEWAEGVP
jgi:hypothetical protein